MIYFDNAATTKPDIDVLDKFVEINKELYANPSSLNTFSKKCDYLYNQAKNNILKSLNLSNYELVFTSGASESNTLAIIGYVLKNKNKGNHIIVSEVEHASILNAAKYLQEKHNIKVSYLKIKEDGRYDENQFKELINENTILVSLMALNNEIGTIYNFDKIKEIINKYPKCKFHSDAVQALGKINIDYSIFDMITFSSHKIHSIKGVGCLIFKNKILLQPIIYGGNQQLSIRSGTLDLAGSLTFAYAINKALKEIDNNLEIITPIHDKIYDYLKNNPSLYELNSNYESKYIINFSLKTKKASVICEALALKDIMLTTVSACSSHVDSSSYVVKALNKPKDIYTNTLRISFSKYNTLEEADIFINTLSLLIKEIKDGR